MSFVIGCGGLVVAALAATEAPIPRNAWQLLSWVIATIAALINFCVQMLFYGEQGYNVLVRDIVAVVLLAIGITLVAAWLTSKFTARGYGPIFRVSCVFFVVLLLSIPTPFIGLLVHCTSGDCL
jgi:hypothetical protein